jgi:GntR family transcriptional regulator, transcriptional repressor for pyruvate dehydrogenase complex
MVLQPVRRRSVPDEVFEQLLAELVSGDLGPGSSLPSERRLAEVLGVSRPAVREALQRLTHAGLVDIRQGDVTTVRDFRRTGGLDLLPRLLVRDGELDLATARSILEARLMLGPQVAALAAQRRDASAVSALWVRVRALAEADDPVTAQREALEFWEVVVDAADSIVFRLMFNSLRAAYEPTLEALAAVMSEEVEQAGTYEQIVHAIVGGDEKAATRHAQDLLGPATRSLLDAIALLDAADPDATTTTIETPEETR